MRILGTRRALRATNTLLTLVVAAYGLLFVILDETEARTATDVVGPLPDALRRIEATDLEPATAYEAAWSLGIGGGIPEPRGPLKDPDDDPPGDFRYVLLWTKVSSVDPTAGVAHLHGRDWETGRSPVSLRFGELVEGRQLVEIRPDRAVLRHPKTGEELVLEVDRVRRRSLDRGRELPPRAAPARFPVKTAEGRWVLPRETVDWIEAWGEEELERVALVDVPRSKAGGAAGIRVKDLPEGHILHRLGVRKEDVLGTINGRPIRSKAELLAWLKGAGNGLDRYEVVVERDGREIRRVYVLSDR